MVEQILSKTYSPSEVEWRIYKLWEKSNFFNPDKLPERHKTPFSIVIPPPNITGSLHMGHALNTIIQDILVRQKRMQGFKTLWLPGTDHAGIATQNVVEKELKKEGLSRHDLGREKFIERVWQWRKIYGNIILDQLKKLGASCDWSRTRFTMDEEYQEAVKEAFLHYFEKGWIYQGKRVINWCPRCQTSLSDLEIEYQEEKSNLWYIKYPLKNSPDFIVVATTRPETMLGDSAVAVNPKDERYKNLVGKMVILPIQNREIPIITDPLIDAKFGTGAVKVTPAHDLTDFEIGLSHKLKSYKAIDEAGRMTGEAGKNYEGLDILECRQKVVEELKSLGLLEKIEPYSHRVAKCYRCEKTIEPLPSKQWFLKMDELAKIAIKEVKNGKVKFIPKKWEKIYFDWLKNIKDWCISRQLWWGHKIPINGVEDVLDTWFSSALWPFATLGWPKKTEDLKTFYPTDILVTDRGIVNLWVARMIFSGMEFMKKIPFRDVYIHATVLTKEGKRMSKSLGTGIDPLGLIEKYGADATRFGIIWQETGAQDIHFGEEAIIAGKKFCNKFWNAARFVLGNKPTRINTNYGSLRSPHEFTRIKNLSEADKKILNELNKLVKSVNKDLGNYHFARALQTIYYFFWHKFCDYYIEESKKQNDEKTQKILLYVLLTSLKLLHPFIPFITEEIYQKLPVQNKKENLMVEEWPEP